jgi:hypothetical protein
VYLFVEGKGLLSSVFTCVWALELFIYMHVCACGCLGVGGVLAGAM